MKILYVLVSSTTDYYYEQMLISMMSAKHQMPNCYISLLIDRESDGALKDSRSLINKYISEKKVIDLDKSLSAMQKSRWLKTSMRNLIEGDFLYVDVDTVFAEPIDENIFSSDVMGVPDANVPINEHPMKEFIIDNLKRIQFKNSLDFHINSGVLYFKDSPEAHSFAECWHKRWEESCRKGVFIDQPALHQAIIDTGEILTLLPDYMNAQFGRNINTLASGVILHYYSSWANDSTYLPAYKFLQKDWLKEFRNDPNSEKFQKDICNPKEAFDPNTFILGRHFNSFWNTRLIQYLMNLWISSDRADKRLFWINESIVLIVRAIYYRLIKILYPFYKLFL